MYYIYIIYMYVYIYAYIVENLSESWRHEKNWKVKGRNKSNINTEI